MNSPHFPLLTFVRSPGKQLCVPRPQVLGFWFSHEAGRDCLEFRLSIGTIRVWGNNLAGCWGRLVALEPLVLTVGDVVTEPEAGKPVTKSRITEIDIRISDRPIS